MVASQDYRDGATQGTQILATRLRSLHFMGVKVTPEIVEQVTAEIGSEFGGTRLTDGELRERARVI